MIIYLGEKGEIKMKYPKLERELAMRVLQSIRKDKLNDVRAYYELYVNQPLQDLKVLGRVNEKYSEYMVRKYVREKEGC
jgi:hypothetical protein